jgi:hypothetical protein
MNMLEGLRNPISHARLSLAGRAFLFSRLFLPNPLNCLEARFWIAFGSPTTRPQRNLTHKDAQNLAPKKALRLIDPRAGLSGVRSTQRPGGKIIKVGSQRIHTFASTAHSA